MTDFNSLTDNAKEILATSSAGRAILQRLQGSTPKGTKNEERNSSPKAAKNESETEEKKEPEVVQIEVAATTPAQDQDTPKGNAVEKADKIEKVIDEQIEIGAAQLVGSPKKSNDNDEGAAEIKASPMKIDKETSRSPKGKMEQAVWSDEDTDDELEIVAIPAEKAGVQIVGNSKKEDDKYEGVAAINVSPVKIDDRKASRSPNEAGKKAYDNRNWSKDGRGGRGPRMWGSQASSSSSSQKAWPKAPLIQIAVVSIKMDGYKGISLTLDDKPYANGNNGPFKQYRIVRGILRQSSDNDIQNASRFSTPKKGEECKKKTGATITSVTLQAWTRSQFCGRIQCNCPGMYYNPAKGDHRDPEHCKLVNIGARVAERMWADEEIEGMDFPEDYLQ